MLATHRDILFLFLVCWWVSIKFSTAAISPPTEPGGSAALVVGSEVMGLGSAIEGGFCWTEDGGETDVDFGFGLGAILTASSGR